MMANHYLVQSVIAAVLCAAMIAVGAVLLSRGDWVFGPVLIILSLIVLVLALRNVRRFRPERNMK